MSLYGAHFVPNKLDPSGKTVGCTGVGGFLGWIWSGSGSAGVCEDDCDSSPPGPYLVICLGVGIGAGGGLSGGGSGEPGCIDDDDATCRMHGQGNLGPYGIDGYLSSDGYGGGFEVGVGGGASGTVEGCFAIDLTPELEKEGDDLEDWCMWDRMGCP
jgi:hypothetical protein